MVRKDAELSLRRQCEVLSLHRSGVYYEPTATDPDELLLMRRIDELHLKYPFYGSRSIARELRNQGHRVNRKRVQRLMRLMDLVSMAPSHKTSKPAPEHPVFPYLLRNLDVCRVNQVWAADITFIPLGEGFAYLVAIMDWHSRRVLSHKLSNTMDARLCVEALEEAMERFGAPEIFNTDQGAQFTSSAFTSVLRKHNVKISMDGKGRCIDNVFIERLWRSLKYEEVYLHSYDDITQARAAIRRYFDFYNHDRAHTALGYQTPAAFYDGLATRRAA